MSEVNEGATTPMTRMTDGSQLESSSNLPVDYAIALAQAGLAVLPLKRASNLPHQMLGSGWSFSEDAEDPFVGARDESLIRSYWSLDPAANVGVITGRPSRLLVVDMDTTKKRSPYDGARWLNAWQNTIGKRLPEGPVVRTPSGGFHLWLRYDGAGYFPTRVGWLPNVDVKVDGGQVAAPPSMRWYHVRPGMGEHRLAGGDVQVDYVWLRPLPSSLDLIPEAPEWLLADVLNRNRATNTGTGSTSQTGSGRLTVEGFLTRGGFGSRTNSRDCDCIAFARVLFNDYGGDTASVTDDVRQVWEVTSDHRSFPWAQAEKCIRSARGYWEKAAS